jgi:pimeloyl-ACP methyl ester carboxylesterase
VTKFVREEYTVDGVKTVLHIAGSGEPVVVFHGAGTVDGFDFAEQWADRFRVIVPYHPGFGQSGDDPTFTDVHDYVMHYLGLFETLGIDKVRLVGISLGGWMAAQFASEHNDRVRKLVLIAPAGMIDPQHPPLDILSVPGEQVVGMLVSNFEVLKPKLPANPSIDFIADRYREVTTLARLWWEHPFDPKFIRHLKRLNMPTMIVWGDQDKIVPVQQTARWQLHIPHADIRVFKGAGHLVHLEKPESVDIIGEFLA